MSEEAKWYVVHTYSGYENKVAATIEKTVENRRLFDQIFTVKVPVETVVELDDEKQKEIERKLFPGYVLVKMIMNDDSWHVVRNTRGVTGFVGPGSKPVSLTDEEVAALGIDKRETTLSYQEGDSVKVIKGPFENFIGTVEEIQKERNVVRVMISIFGKETPVEMELTQVAPV